MDIARKVYDPWQEENGPRFGNRRKEMSRLKIEAHRKQKRKDNNQWKKDHDL